MTGLRAVFDDGERHSEGKVRGMWSSGLVVESEAAPRAGSLVALVVLSGGFDGERLTARVVQTERGTVMLDLMDLDTARWSRLQALVDGKPPAVPLPIDRPAKAPPPDAPVFILSGGEDDLGDPTDAVSVAPAPRHAAGAAPASPFQIPSPLESGVKGSPRSPASADEADQQLMELGRRNQALAAENAQLRADLAKAQSQLALKAALEEELADALGRLESIEKSLKR